MVYLVPHPQGLLTRYNRAAIVGEPGGSVSQLHIKAVQLSVFDSQTRHHRVDHRNLKLGQRTAAWRLPNRSTLRFHVCGLGYLSNPDATRETVGMENFLGPEPCIYKHGDQKNGQHHWK